MTPKDVFVLSLKARMISTVLAQVRIKMIASAHMANARLKIVTVQARNSIGLQMKDAMCSTYGCCDIMSMADLR